MYSRVFLIIYNPYKLLSSKIQRKTNYVFN